MTFFLVDKSALEQQRRSDEANRTLNLLAAENRLAICAIVALAVLYSTRGPTDYEDRWNHLSSLTWLPVTSEVCQTALDIQRRLAAQGQHRRPIPDLLIAATGLVHDAIVLHYDKDFDLISGITGQPARWIIPRGSL